MNDESEGGRIFFSSTGRTLAEEDEICVLSVGVDIGSSTSHLVFSRIVLERNPGYRPRFYDEQPPADDPRSQAIARRLQGRRLPMIDRVEISIVEESQPRLLGFDVGGSIGGQGDRLVRLALVTADHGVVEAVPVAPDSIVLIITRVEDPQELDTRFAKFAPSGDDTDGPEPVQYSGADDIIDLFHKLCDVKNKAQEIAKKAAQKENEKEPAASEEKNVDLVRTFHFSTLDDVISSAKALNQYFTGSNSLYKNRADANYQLVLHQSGCKPEEFNKVCNILSEYGVGRAFTPAGEAYLREHGTLIADDALQKLLKL